MRHFLLSGLFSLYVLLSYAQDDSVAYQLYFVGDAGETTFDSTLEIISKHAKLYNAPSAAIFLGDNIYPKGLPDKHHKNRKASEQILLKEISLASQFDHVYFIPGNHDWKKGQRSGVHSLMNQQKFIDSLKNPKIHFLPRDGCPGPEEIHLGNDLVLAMIDTHWFLHPWDKPHGETSHCEAKTPVDITIQLDDILNRNQGKRVLVIGHHPVFSYGQHGGVFTLKDHLFPLTEINKNFYLPLPIIGSLMPLYRKIFGNVQDFAHPLNKSMRRGLQEIMEQYPGTTYISGHEHSLQHIESDGVTYVVSGAGSKSSPVKKKGFSKFASSEIGFARMLITKNGDALVEYFSAAGKLYSIALPKIKKVEIKEFLEEENDTLWTTIMASHNYEAGSARRKLLGDNYRPEWAQRITIQAFDIGRANGGLKILKRGGGAETMTLRLRDSLGREYNLRSVDKFPTKALPATFRKTFLQTVKQDQVSASHPYASLVIPPLAKAAGIYYANPQLVYAPADPRWGVYKKDFAGQMMTFEERLDGDGRDRPSFGRPEKIISTRRLLEHMAEDHDTQVDQKLVLRSRLFDMWIGDWDRHDDQWRWGEFKHQKTKIYRPIPRDRDRAFFVNEGAVPHKFRKRALSPQLEGFDSKIRWAPGLMSVGRWFDKSFLNTIPEEEFFITALELSTLLTDQVIDSALKLWPPEIYALHGNIIAEKLKARRGILVENARSYYRFMAKEVDIVGSNKREWFEVNTLVNGNLNLQMFGRDKDGRQGKKLLEREFIKDQTKELRLYGFGGDDVFHFSGSGQTKAKVRIIGGDGNDLVTNEASGPDIYLYDIKNGTKMEGARIHDRTSSDPLVNEYDRKAYEYNKFIQHNTVTYNIDDGFFIGTGFSKVAHGFRKKPYQSHHVLQGSYAIRTSSFNIHYEGRFPQFINKWDLELSGDIKSPNYVNNFFGWGNESVFDQNINQSPDISVTNSIDYYRLRFREIKADVMLSRKIGEWGYFKAGPVFQRGEIVNPSEDRFIKEYAATLEEPILGVAKNFGGIAYSWGIDKRDNYSYTTRGIVFKQSSRYMDGFDAPGFTSHTTSFTLYQSFRLPAKVTYVFNAGLGHNTGTYQLYQAQALDGKTEIRGFRKTRFYGDTKVYFNNEVRIKLTTLRTYLFPASIGVHAFYDVGRVWYKDPNGIDPSAPTGTSDDWHRGYGGGVWFTPFDLKIIAAEVAHSNEGNLFYIRLGFLF